MKYPLLSIIVPVYNTMNTLDRCIHSILSQSYKDLELILVDDGSTDKSTTKCDEWAKRDSRIVTIHKENGGLSDARNAGMSIARGDYITFVDSDDYINEGIYERMINFLSTHRNIDMIEFSINNIGCERQYVEYKDRVFPDVRSYWYDALPWFHSYMCNKIYKRSVVDNIRFKIGRTYEDKIFLAQFLKEKNPNIATSSFIGYNYVFQENAITNTKTIKHIIDVLYADIYALLTMRTTPFSRNGIKIYGNIYCHLCDFFRYFKAKTHKAS